MPENLALPEAKLLEGVVTTTNADGTTNISPMGPLVDASFTRLLLRPFQTSTTYTNLKRTRVGILHVTDDVELLAHAAVGVVDPSPRLIPAEAVEGQILADACRWYAFRVEAIEDAHQRTHIPAHVVDQRRQRDFFGFNRAKHAVVEAAILATRVDFLPANDIREQFERLAVVVEKTAGHQERRAFAFLKQYVNRQLAQPSTGVAHR